MLKMDVGIKLERSKKCYFLGFDMQEKRYTAKLKETEPY